MKKIVFLALVSAFILAQSALTADTYVFDKRHSTMGFQIRHLFEKIPGNQIIEGTQAVGDDVDIDLRVSADKK
jgi:polyisoprenoid-binding protein YceI